MAAPRSSQRRIALAGSAFAAPQGSLKATRVLRGGSWNNNARNLRAAQRNHNPPDNRNNNIGFRLCCVSHIGALPQAGYLGGARLAQQGAARGRWRRPVLPAHGGAPSALACRAHR
jgi:hypothetical protein